MEHETINKCTEFLKNINIDDKIAILHHTDPDGICSGTIIAKTIERIRNKKIDLRINQMQAEVFVTKDTINIVKKANINKIIITDLAVDQDPTTIKELEKFTQILIIDHHKVYFNLNNKSTILIKPELIQSKIDPAQYCASKLCFDLGNKIIDINDLDWIAAIGIIGDFAFSGWKEFLDKVFKKYKINNPKDSNAMKTDLGKIAQYLSESEAYNIKNVEKCFKIVYNAKSYKEILKSQELLKSHKLINSEINKWLNNTKEWAEWHKDIDLILYEIKSKHHIKSSLSTLLSIEYPNKTLILMQEENKKIFISARRQDKKVKVNNLLEKAINNLSNANAGGHIPAAGGSISSKDKKIFKSNIINILLKDKNKT